jgi:hypothetical protein
LGRWVAIAVRATLTTPCVMSSVCLRI